jgi:DNA invertase Pin-like site-specific DNA recombinase
MLVDEGTQAAVLEQYILDHGLWNTRGYFDSDTDDLTPLGERRQGALLLADAERGLFDVVVIATPSCLSRSLDVIADTIARLAIAGVGLRVAAGDPDE